MKLIKFNKYKFKYGTDELVYIGKYGRWHQFELDGVLWAEVLDEDLGNIEEVK